MDRITFASNNPKEAVERCSAVWSAHLIIPRRSTDFGIEFDCAPVNRDLSVTTLHFPSGADVVPWARAQVTIIPIVHRGQVTTTTGQRSHVIGEGQIGAIDAHSASRVEYSEGFKATIMRISNQRLMRYVNRVTQKDASAGVTFHGNGEVDPDTGNSLWAPVLRMTENIDLCAPMAANPRLAGHFEEMVFCTLLSGIPNSRSSDLEHYPGQAAPRHVVAAERFIFANLSNSITTPDIAAAAGVSIRSLFDGFRDFRQTTPMQFMREARLDAAHTMLQQGDHSIANVALACGFTHPGHFAKHYRTRFAQTPSWTRKFG